VALVLRMARRLQLRSQLRPCHTDVTHRIPSYARSTIGTAMHISRVKGIPVVNMSDGEAVEIDVV
jgi:hypothetical protein